MDVNTKNFRIFLEVIRVQSFSEAARVLKITQPTVSQQIAKLESDVGGRLFERKGHELIPTELATRLSSYAEEILDKLSSFREEVHVFKNNPSGLVRYAMPESCQWTPHFKSIMRKMRTYPEIQFEVSILPTRETTDGILSGQFEFGFITGERLTPELRFEKFSDETYSCVASDQRSFEPLEKSKFKELRLITFPGWELFFSTWAKSEDLGKTLKNNLARPILSVGTLAGAIHAVKEGVGVAVLPTHCIVDDFSSNNLYEYKTKSLVASCPIYLCMKVGRQKVHRVDLVIELLKRAKREIT